MPEDAEICIKEAYRDYTPPLNVAKTVRLLLRSVPPKYLRGLDCVVLTNLSGQPRRNRVGKIIRRGRRVSRSHVAGLYHRQWQGNPPWIELYVDQILRSLPRWSSWIPLITTQLIAETLFHELGHHIHLFIRPEYREKEDVADDWKKKLHGNFIQKRYFYLIPLIRTINFLRRRTTASSELPPSPS